MSYKLSPEEEKVRRGYDMLSHLYGPIHTIQTLGTDNAYRKLVAEHASIQEGDMVLDIGTGWALSALKALETQPNCTITGIDFSFAQLSEAGKQLSKTGTQDRIYLVDSDVKYLPFSDNTFDVIISTYGLGSVKDKNRAIDEIRRVAKPYATFSVVEMIEPPQEYGSIARIFHRCVTNSIISFIWYTDDTDLLTLFREHNIDIIYNKYLRDRIIGSSQLVIGVIKK